MRTCQIATIPRLSRLLPDSLSLLEHFRFQQYVAGMGGGLGSRGHIDFLHLRSQNSALSFRSAFLPCFRSEKALFLPVLLADMASFPPSTPEEEAVDASLPTGAMSPERATIAKTRECPAGILAGGRGRSRAVLSGPPTCA